MKRGREDQLSETSSRPAFLDEFERKLAAALAQHAALAQETDARKTRFGSARSSDVQCRGTVIAIPRRGYHAPFDG